MSSVRRNSNRRSVRAQHSSPYNRTNRGSSRDGNKGTGWGVADFIFGFFKRATPEEEPEYDEMVTDEEDIPPPRVVVHREPSIQEVSPPRTSTRRTEPPRTPSMPSDDDQPSSKVQKVSKFLAENSHRQLNSVEVAGLVALLEGSVQDEPEQPFRFSPSPLTTPVRGTTPDITFIGSSSSAPALPTAGFSSQASGKSLAKNPNGVYRWQGAGSARPRTRYQSPAFGPSKSMPIRMKLTAQMPTTDKKRRRVGQDAESSGPQRTPAASSSSNANGQSQASASGTFVNGATSPPPSRTKAPVQPSTPRIRTNNLPAKPTAPTNPSPLRQAWNHNDSPSPPQPPASKPTRAANLMSELLKMDVPVPTPDFSNPYEAAGPVPAKPATRRPVTKRPRVVAANHAEMKKEEKKEEKKVAEMSPQKIIEATVPKGSKRSRPPPDLDSSGPKTDPREPPAPRRSSRLKSPEPRVTNGINGIAGASNGARVPPPVVEEDESPTKKQKTSTASGLMNNKKMTVTIEEVEDVDMPAPPSTYTRPSEIIEPVDSPQRQRSQSPTAATSPTSPVRNPYGMKSSAPKAPSKLRYSIKADADSDKGEDDEKEKNMPSFAFPPLPLPRNRAAASSSTSTSSAPAKPIAPTRSKSISKSEAETKDSVLTLAVEDLPKFTFAAPAFSPVAGPGPSTQKSRELAIAAAKAALPAFDFSTRSMSFGTTWGKSAAAPQSTVSIAKPPGTSVGEQWTCSTCMLKNPASATEKCTVCDESRPKPASAPATGGFNWAAAGMKKPEAAEAKWTCSVCMLSNPPSATQCTVCEADR